MQVKNSNNLFLRKILVPLQSRQNGPTWLWEGPFAFFLKSVVHIFLTFLHKAKGVWALKSTLYCFVSETLVCPQLKQMCQNRSRMASLSFYQGLCNWFFVFLHEVRQLEILRSPAKLDLKSSLIYFSNLCIGFWRFRRR